MKRIRRGRPSPSMVISVIALVLALTGTAVAAGKIKVSALTGGAKNKTVGVGVLSYVTLNNAVPPTPAPPAAGSNGTNVRVACPRNRVVIGGGIKVGNDANSRVIDSHPVRGGWVGTVTNTGGATGALSDTASVVAICATSRRVTTGALPTG